MPIVIVHTPIRGRAQAGEHIELDEATIAALEALGAVERVAVKKYQNGAGPSDAGAGAMAPALDKEGKAAGAEEQPAAADPGATAAPITAGAAGVSRGESQAQGAAAPTAPASDQPAEAPRPPVAVPIAAAPAPRKPRAPRKPKVA